MASTPPPPGAAPPPYGSPGAPVGYPGAYSGAPPPAAPPPKKKMPLWAVILIVLVGGFFVVGGPMAVFAVYGVRKYLGNAKSAEAKVSLGQLARLAGDAYARDGRVCPSASRPVPEDRAMVSGKKYQSAPRDWTVDAKRNAGFACLGFAMHVPQYYQYEWTADANGFTAVARGDLNGDGVFSRLSLRGQVVAGTLRVEPAMEMEDPLE